MINSLGFETINSLGYFVPQQKLTDTHGERGKLTLVPHHPFQSHVLQGMDHGIPEDGVCYWSSHTNRWKHPEINKMNKASDHMTVSLPMFAWTNLTRKQPRGNPVCCTALENMETVLSFHQALLRESVAISSV